MDKYERRERNESLFFIVALFSLVGGMGLMMVKLHQNNQEALQWEPASQGETLYGKPMIIVSDENLICRYWNWQHPFTENRITVQECTPKTPKLEH